MERVSKTAYLAWWLGATILGLVAAAGAVYALLSAERDSWPALVLSRVVLACASLVRVAVIAHLVHRMWSAIREFGGRTRPAAGAAFLFIPIFNLYWIFRALWGWTKEYNHIRAERGIPAPRMPEGIALSACVLSVFLNLSYLAVVLRLAYVFSAPATLVVGCVQFVLLTLFIVKACNGINGLPLTGVAGKPRRRRVGNTVAIMQRELLSLFFSPIGYIVITGFLLITGVLVMDSFGPGKPATLRSVFGFTPYVLTFIVPAIAMRTISEEYRSGTIETLMTAPVSDVQMVIGKYLAALVFYAIMLAGTLIYLILMMIFGSPDMGASFCSYLGLLLVGVAFTAFGVFASSLTRNQIVAWIVGAVPLILFVWFAGFIVDRTEGWVRDAFQRVNVVRHLDQFNRGLVTLEGLVFFVGAAALFLFLTVKVVESHRWR